jgi:4-hydroxybenzoate polyprenyltransferase
MKSLAKNWWIFTQERFNLAVHVPMVLCFSLVNYFVPLQVNKLDFESTRFLCYFALLFSFFFRMRVFDEIKDYQVDLKVNPLRPLARGILSVAQAKVMILVLYVFELLLAWNLGGLVFAIFIIPAFYSLLMYEEFFIGDWIRPHLTTYAVLHTFVSSLLGLIGYLVATENLGLNREMICFLLMNWCFFNLFEFARKSFAATEERPHVESYTKIFGSRGAVALSLSQVLIGVFLCSQLFSAQWLWLGAGLYLLCCLPAILKPESHGFKIFRNSSSVYLLVHYILIVYSVWGLQ